MASLTVQQIEAYLEEILDGERSEDDLEDFDESENECFSKCLENNEEENVVNGNEDENYTIVEDCCEDEQFPSTSQASRRASMRGLVWKQKKFGLSAEQTSFRGTVTYPSDLKNHSGTGTPYIFFSYFATTELIQKIVDESNLYALQSNIEKPLNVSEIELRKFIAILLYMSVIKYPNARLYWSDKNGFDPIKKLMTVNRFETIRKYLHFNNNDEHLPRDHIQHDRLFKIRPFIDYLNERFGTIPMNQRLAIDEQMCATKVAHYMKQYLPNKPHKWGFKLFVMCSVKGYAHKFEIYTGETHKRQNDEPDLGPVGNIVVRLSRNVHRNVNHILYFDNFYTTIPLVTHFAKQGIFCLGTVQANRLVNSKFPDKKAMLKKSFPRGFYAEQVVDFEGVELVAVTWKDNKVVTLLSSCVGAEPVSQIERFNKAEKKKINILCPQIVKDYNAHMGGVDLMDSFIGRYRICMKSRKWYIRIFYHLIDMCVINSWLVYKDLNGEGNLNLCQYRLQLAEVLGNVGHASEICNKRGRPSGENSIQKELQAKKLRGRTQIVPPKDLRIDNVGHWPQHCPRGRCKMPGCKGYTQTSCEKCGVSLCFNKTNNCFKNFHA